VLWTKIVIVAVAGGLGAGLANRGMAFFHDATRSIVPEMASGRMPRREFVQLALGSNIGLLLWFGIPFSLVSTIVLSHGLWLGTDIIGAWFPGSSADEKSTARKSYLGLLGAIASGAVYGTLLVIVLSGCAQLVARLPVNFYTSTANLGSLVIFSVAAIPALAIAYQYGVKPGVLAFLLTVLGRQIASGLGQANPDVWAFLLGLVALIILAAREAKCEAAPEETFAISTEHLRRIRSYLPWIAMLGAVYALAANQGVLMEGPQSLLAWAQGNRAAAVAFTATRALSFLPMRTMSILTTGVFTMDGLGFAPAAGLLSPNAVVAALAGAVVITVETLSLGVISRFFNRFPCMLKAANSLRTAMTKLLEVASLVGGMLAANALSPGFGFVAAAGLYGLNEAAGTPIIRVAIGPVAILLVGITLNLLALVGLR
jgi:hypothetical protein